ncbi:Actin- protein 10, partial [Borealophlyctis nickersoniae]
TIPVAGESVTMRLKSLLKNHGSLISEGGPGSAPSENFVESLPLEFYENLKAQACFVGAFPTFADVSDENREKAYPYRERSFPYTIYNSTASPALCTVDATDQMSVPGWVRERAAEILFDGDDDGCSVATVVLDALLKCPQDIRTELAQNILLVGGTSMLPGFQDRLHEQILRALEDMKRYEKLRRIAIKIRFVKSIFTANSAAWVGGSLLGSLKTTVGKEILKDNFLKDGIIPDWTSIASP